MFFVEMLCVFVFGLAIANSANISSHIDSDGCILPKYPINGHWTVKEWFNKRLPGEKVGEGVDVTVKCDNGYQLDGFISATCLNGKWNLEIGRCIELSLMTEPSSVTCTTNGLVSDCNTPTNGTIATDSCGPFYENEEINRNPFRIYKNGRWNKDVISCSAVCGLAPLSSNNGTLRHFSPWNVLMYYNTRPFCAGTLINEKTVLTSAICLKDVLFAGQSEPSIDLVSITLAVGKRIQEYPFMGPETQYSTIQSLFLPETFKSFPEKLISDIAIIIVRKPFLMTIWVQPACVDWSNKSRSDFPHQKRTSKVVAIKQSNNFLDFYEVDVLLLDDVECSELIDTKVRNMTDYSSYYQFSYTTIDKYCARNISSHYSSSCSNKIGLGAGLMTKNSIDGKQYITGITSLGSIDNDCNNNTFTLFTRISDHIGLIAEKSTYNPTTEGDQSGTSCGMKLRNTTTQINYPWQVAIYKIDSTQNDLVCGGSLISQRLILTSAHCVTTVNGEKLPKEKFIIAVGKNYRNFDDSRDDNSQFSAVKEIITPFEYKGRLENYLADIAILVSETLFDLSKGIQPICLDWGTRYESHFLNSNVTGFVARFTAKNQNNSQDENNLKVSFMDQQQCKNELPADIKKYSISDKLCLKFINKGFCRKESGDAIVFKNNKDGRYYLAGVISVWPQYSSSGCNGQEYVLYTRISIYIKNFIWKAFTKYLS